MGVVTIMEGELHLDTVIQGDCFQVLNSLPEGSVDSVIFSPPYLLGP
jgi:DNA modification methylase